MQQGDNDLAKFDQDFANAKVEENEYEDVPDGKYQCNVENVELARSKEKKTPMLKWQLKIISPKFIGRMLFRNNMIASAENVKWLKNDLATCGMEVEAFKLSELPTRLAELLDVKLEVQVVTKGEYTNVYLNRVVIMGGDPIPESYHNQPPPPDEPGDVPF